MSTGWDSDNLWSDNTNEGNAWGTPNASETSNAWPDTSGSSEPVNNTWSETTDDAWGEVDDNAWGNTSTNSTSVQQEVQAPTNAAPAKPLGSKTLAFAVLGIGLVIALVILFISRIDISKKDETPTKPVTQQQSQQAVTQYDVGLKEVTGVSSNTEYTVNGSIYNKLYYATNNQVLCGIQIKIDFGSESEIWTYYCAYNIYKQVDIGDMVKVTYSKPNDNFIMIHGVSK